MVEMKVPVWIALVAKRPEQIAHGLEQLEAFQIAFFHCSFSLFAHERRHTHAVPPAESIATSLLSDRSVSPRRTRDTGMMRI